MKKRIKSILITFMLLATLIFVTACANSGTPYDRNDKEGFNVSVRYDANGGLFTTGTTVITDSYKVEGMQTNSNGNVELALLAPDNESRYESFEVVKNGYFLAGWYTERSESSDGKFTYANKWDFEKGRLEIDPKEDHTASEPVVTLYAVWVPLFEIEFKNMDGTVLDTMNFNPSSKTEIKIPQWNEETGAMEYFKFPKRSGYTFQAAYYDAEGTQPVEGTIQHPGIVDAATGTATNSKLTVYVDWKEGEWYRITTAEQLYENASVKGCYEILADLDFLGGTDEAIYWPDNLMAGNFSGKIVGNGHTIKNVTFEQKGNLSKLNIGLFGNLTADASITDLTFENVTFTLAPTIRNPGASFGLLAGSITDGAELSNVKILNSTIRIDSDTIYLGTDDYVIGKVAGTGYADQIDFTGVTVEVFCSIEGNVPQYTVEEDGNAITLVSK